MDIAQEFPTKPSRIFGEPLYLAKKKVTQLLPTTAPIYSPIETATLSCGQFLPVTRPGSAESRTAGCIAGAADDRVSRANAGSPAQLSN